MRKSNNLAWGCKLGCSMGTGPATDPKFQLALAAWDASNRNALRSTELFHPNRASVDGLDVVQVSLDTFSLRVGRETSAGLPQ